MLFPFLQEDNLEQIQDLQQEILTLKDELSKAIEKMLHSSEENQSVREKDQKLLQNTQSELENTKSELIEAKSVIDKQDNELSDMTNKLFTANENITEIREKYEVCQSCVQQQTDEVNDLLSEFNVTDLTLKGAKDLVHTLKKEIERDKQNVTDLETEHSSIKQDMVLTEVSYKEKVLDLTQEINLKQKEVEKISEESEDFKRKLESAMLETNQLKREIDTIKEGQTLKGDELESKIHNLLSQINDSEKLLSEKSNTVQEQSKQIETMKCDAHEMAEENKLYKSELLLLKTACDEKDKTLTDLNNSYSRVEEMFRQLEAECHNLNTEVGERDTKIHDLVTNVEALEYNLRGEEQRLLDLSTQKDIIESENHVMKEEIVQKDSLTANLIHKLNEESQRRLSEEEQVTYLKTSNEETLKCLKSLELEAEHVKSDLETTQLDLDRIKKLCSEKDTTVHDLTETVETITSENQRLEVCSSEALEKLTLTETSLQEVVQKLKAAEETLLVVQAENERLQTQVSGMQHECNQKHEQLCNLQASLSQVQTENDFLKTEMQTLEKSALDCSSDVVSLLKHVCCLNSEVQLKLSLVLSQHEDMSQNFNSASSSISELSLKSDDENLPLVTDTMENEHETSVCRNYLICITKHLNSAKTEIESLNMNSMKIFSHISDMSHSAKDLETVLASLQSKNTDLRASVQHFESLLNEKLSEIEILQSSQSGLQMTIKRLKGRLHDIEPAGAISQPESEVSIILSDNGSVNSSDIKELDDSSQYSPCDKQNSASDNGKLLLENQVLKCQICDLNDNLKIFDGKCQTLEAEVQKVKENWNKLQTSLGSIENSYQTAQKEKEALQAKFDFTKEKMDLMHDERDRYKSDVQRLSDELKKLSSQHAIGDSPFDVLTSNIETATQNANNVNEQETLHPDLKNLQKDNIDLQIKVESCEKALQEKESSCKNLQLLNEKCLAELSDFKVKIESITSRYDQLETLYTALLEEKQSADDEIKKEIERNESLTKQISDVQQEIEFLKQKAEIAEADWEKQVIECKSQTSQFEELTQDKQRLQEIVNTTQDSIRLSHSVVHQQLLEVEDKYKDKEDTLKTLNEEFKAVSKEYEELKEKHMQSTCQITLLTEDNLDLKTQISSLNETLQESIAQQKDLTDENEDLVAKIDLKAKDICEKESEMSNLQSLLEVSEINVEDLSNSLKTHKEILQEKKNLISQLAEILHLQNVDEQDYLLHVESILHQRANLERELNENSSTLQSLQLEFEEKDQICKKLASLNEKYETDLKDLRIAGELTNNRKEELENEYSCLVSEKDIADSELQKSLEEIKCFADTISCLQQEISTLESRNSEINDIIVSSKLTIETLQSDKDKQIGENNLNLSKLSKAEEENKKLIETTKNLQESLAVSHNTVESKQEELVEFENKQKSLEDSLSVKANESETLREECNRLKEDNKCSIDKIEIISQELEDSNLQMCSLKEALQKAAFIQTGLETSNAMLIVEKENMAKALSEEGLAISNFEAEIRDNKSKLKEAQLDMHEKDKINNELQVKTSKYQNELDDLRKEVDLTKQKHEELEKEYSFLISAKEIANNELSKTLEENECFTATISDLQKEISSLKSEIIELNSALTSSELTIETLRSEKENLNDQRSSYMLKLTELDQENKQLSETVNKSQESLTLSNSTVKMKLKELHEMESKCKTLENSSESLRGECTKLKEDGKCSIDQKEILAQEIVDLNLQLCSLKESLQKAAFSQKGLEISNAKLLKENENNAKTLTEKDIEISHLEKELRINKDNVEETLQTLKSLELAQEEKNSVFSQISTTLLLPNVDDLDIVSQISHLVDKKVKLEAELIRSETNCQDVLAEKCRMEETLKELKAIHLANEVELKEATARFSEVDETRQKLVEEVDDLTGELAEYKNRLSTAENEISDCENKILSLTSDLNELKEGNEVLSKQMETLESQNKIMSSSLSENETKLSETKTDLENKEKMCQEISSQMSILSEKVSIKDSENTDLDEKIRQLQEEVLNLSETLDDRNELVTLKESLLETMSEDLNEKKEVCEKQLLEKEAMSEELNKLKEIMEQSHAAVNEKREEIISLEQKYTDLQEHLSNEEQKVENLQSRLIKIKDQFLQLLMQIYECNRENSESHTAPASPFENLNDSNPESEENDEEWVTEFVKETETMQKNLQNLRQSYNRKEEDFMQLQDKLKESESQQEIREVKITEMQHSVNEKDTEIANLANNVQELETNLQKIKEERDLKVELLSDNVEDLVKQLDSCTQQRDDLESELTDAMSNLENTESARLNLEEELKSNAICLEEKSAALEVLQDQFSGLSDENSKLVKTLHERESTIMSKDSQIEQLTLEKQDLLLDCSNLEKLEKELNVSVQTLQEKTEMLEGELSTNQHEHGLKCEELFKLEEQLKQSQIKLDDLSSEISYLESSGEKYKDEIMSLESSLADLNESITHIKGINKELHSQMENKDIQIQIIDDELKNSIKDHASDEAVCSKLCFENQALKRNVERFEERLDEASTKEAELKSFVDTYSIQIEEMDTNKAEMSRSIEQMKKDTENLNQMLKDEKEAHQESKMAMEKLTEDSKEINENNMTQLSLLQNSYQDTLAKLCSMESECCCQFLKYKQMKHMKDISEHDKESLTSQNESLEKQLLEQFQWVSEHRKESDRKDKMIEAHLALESEASELKESVLHLKEDQTVKSAMIMSLENELKIVNKKLEDAEVKSLALVIGLEADKDALMIEIDEMKKKHPCENGILTETLQKPEETSSTGEVIESMKNETLVNYQVEGNPLEDESNTAKSNVNETFKEIKTLESSVGDVRNENELLVSSASQLTKICETQRSEIENMELLKTELEDKLEILKQDHDKALNDLSSSMAEVERLSSQVKEGDIRNKELFQTSVELSKKVEDSDSEVERLAHCLNTANSELREYQTCLCKKDEEIHILENSISSLREEYLSDKSVLSRLMMDMNGANQKFSVLIDTIIEKDKAMTNIENQLSEVNLMLEEANRNKSKSDEEIKAKSEEIASLLTESEEIERLLKDKNLEIEKLASSLETHMQLLNSTSEKFDTCKEEKYSMETELSEIKELFEKQNDELMFLKSQISTLEKVLSEANMQSTSYIQTSQKDGAEMEYLLENAKSLMNVLGKKQIEIDSLQKKNEDVQEAASKYEDLITYKTSQISVLAEELELAESRLQSLISVNSKNAVQKQDCENMLEDAKSKETYGVMLSKKEKECLEDEEAENKNILPSLELSEQALSEKQNLIDQLLLEKSALVTRLKNFNETDYKSLKENSRSLKDSLLNLKHDFLNYQESLTDQILSAMSSCNLSIDNDICSLQMQIKDEADLIADNKVTIQSLEKQRDEILEQLNVRQAEYDTILSQYQILEESNQNLRLKIEETEIEMGKIREALANESQLVQTLEQTVQDTKYRLKEALTEKEKTASLIDEHAHFADENVRLESLQEGTSHETEEIALHTQETQDHLQSKNDQVDVSGVQVPHEQDISTFKTLNDMIVVQSQQIQALEQELASLKETQMPAIEWDDYDLRDICNRLEKEKQDLAAEVSNQSKVMKKKDVQIKTLSRQLETLNTEMQEKPEKDYTNNGLEVSESEIIDVAPIDHIESIENQPSEVESFITPVNTSSLASMVVKEAETQAMHLEETDLDALKEKLNKVTQERDKYKTDNKKLLKVGKGKDTKVNLMNKNFEKIRQERDALLAERDSLENELQDVNSKSSNFDSSYDKEVINNLMMRCKELEAVCEEKQIENIRPGIQNVSQSGDSSQPVIVLDNITVSASNKLEEGQDTVQVASLSKPDSKLKAEVIKLQKINKGKEAKIRKMEEKLSVQENETKNLKEILSQKDEDMSISVEDRAAFEKMNETKIILEFELQCAKEELAKVKQSQSINGEAIDKEREVVTEKDDTSEQLDISEFSEEIVRSKVIAVLQENKRLKQENNKLLKLSKGKEAKVKKAEDLITQQQKIISDKDTDILILKESVKDLTSKFEALDEDEHDLRYRLETALMDRDEWYDHCQNLEDQLDAAHESIDMKNDELIRLDEAADADRETMDNLMYERDSLEREVESLKNELELLQNSLDKKDEEIKKLETKLEETIEQKEKLTSDIKKLNMVKKGKEAKAKKLEESMIVQGSAIEANEEYITGLENKMKEAQSHLHAFKQENENLRSQMQSLELYKDDLENEMGKLNSKLNDQNQQIKHLHEVNEAHYENFESQTSRMVEEIQNQEMSTSELKEQLHITANQNIDLEKRLVESEQTMQHMNMQLAEKEESISDLTKKLLDGDQEIHAKLAALSSSQESMKDLMTQIDEKDKYMTDLLEKIEAHEKAAEQSMWETHNLQEQLHNLSTVNQELEQIIQTKAEALDSTTARCDALKAQFDSNISMLQEKDNEVSALRKKYLALDQESIMKQSLLEEKEKHFTNMSEEEILKLQKLVEEQNANLHVLAAENHNLHLENENIKQTIEKLSIDNENSKQQWLSEKYDFEQNLNWYMQYHETSTAEMETLLIEKESNETKLQESNTRITELSEGLKISEDSMEKLIKEKEEYEAKLQLLDAKLTENTETLKKREESVQKMLGEKEEILHDLQTKNNQLIEKINLYESDSSERKTYEASLMKEFENLRNLYEDTETKLKDAEEFSQKASFEKDHLVMQYNQALEKATMLENESNQRGTSEHELRQEIESLKYQNQDISNRLNECAEELKKALDLVQNINTEKSELQSRLNQSLEDSKSSLNSEETLQQMLTEKEQLLNEWYNKYCQVLESVNAYETDLKTSRSHMDNLNQEIENVRGQYQEVGDKLKNAEISNQRYSTEIEELRTNYTQAHEKLRQYESEVKERGSVEDKLRDEINHLKSENENMCTKLERYSAELKQSEDVIQNTCLEKEKLQTNLQMYENNLTVRGNIADELREENDNLKTQNQSMKDQIESCSVKLRETEELMQNTLAEKENLQTSLRESCEKSEMFENTLKEKCYLEDDLHKEIESLRNQCQDMNVKMVECSESLKNACESNDSILKEKEELQSNYKDTLTKLEFYENELRDKTMYQEQLINDIETLRHQCHELNSKLLESSEKLQKAEESVNKIQAQYSQALEKQVVHENECKLKSDHANELLLELETLRTQYQQLAMQREQEISEKDNLVVSIESPLKAKLKIHAQSPTVTAPDMQDLNNVPVHEEMIQAHAAGMKSSKKQEEGNEPTKVRDKEDNGGNEMLMEVKKLKKLCKGKDARIKKLEEKLKAASEAPLSKTATNDEDEANMLKSDFQQVESSPKDLQEKEKLLLEKENLSGQVSSMQTRIDTLLHDQTESSELENAMKNQITQLQAYSESIANELQAYKDANDQWQTYVSQLQTDHNENMQQSQTVVDTLTAQLNECSNQISALSQSKEEYNGKLQSVLKEKEECLSLTSVKDDELKDLKDIMKQQMTEIQDLKKKLELGEQTDKGLQSEKERFEELLKSEREEIQSLYEQMNELVSEKLDLESMVQAKDQDLKAAKETLEVLAAEREKWEELKSEKEELQLEVETLSRDISTLRERFGEKDLEREKLVNNLNQKETALEEVRAQLLEFESEKKMVDEKLKNTSDELLLTQDNAEALAQELETKKEAATKLKDMCFEKDQLVESLKETIQTMSDENQSLKQQKDQVYDELVLYKQQYHEESKKSHDNEAKLNKLSKNCKQLEESVTEKTNALISKAEEIGALHRQITSLEEALKKLDRQNSAELQKTQAKEEMVKLQTVAVHGAVESAVVEQGQSHIMPNMSSIESQILTAEAVVPVAMQAPTDKGFIAQVYYTIMVLKYNQLTSNINMLTLYIT